MAAPAPVAEAEAEAEAHAGAIRDKPKGVDTVYPLSFGGQLRGVLRMHALLKLRHWRVTLCELLSPTLLVGVLVVGYLLSRDSNYGARMYADVDVSLPPPLVDTLVETYTAPLNGAGAEGASPSPTVRSFPPTIAPTPAPTVALMDDDGGGGGTDDTASGKPPLSNQQRGTRRSVWGLYRMLQELTEGPLLVPSFDAFVLMGEGIRWGLSSVNYPAVAAKTELGLAFGNLLVSGKLHFAPDTNITRSFVDHLSRNTMRFNSIPHAVHRSENTALKAITDELYSQRVWALIVFDDTPSARDTASSGGAVSYTIRMNQTVLPNTAWVTNWVAVGLDRWYQRYWFSGFLTLQRTVDEFLFRHVNENREVYNVAEVGTAKATPYPLWSEKQCNKPPDVVATPFPTAPYTSNIYFIAVGYMLGLAMAMAALYPVSRLCKALVEDKESRMRETMKIMGLRDSVYLLGFFLTALATFTSIAVILTALCVTSFLEHSEPALIFLYFFLFLLAEISFSYFMSVWFSKAKLAAIMAPVALFITLLPRYIFFGSNRYEAALAKYAASILPPTAFAMGADIIADYEYSNIGVGWNNYTEGKYDMAGCLVVLFVDFWIFAILGLYLEQVLPSEYGTRRHPLFFLDRAFWASCFPATMATVAVSAGATDNPNPNPSTSGRHTDPEQQDDPADDAVLERVDASVASRERVSISHLWKRYDDGKLAVRGLNLAMYEGQITCLLGHNGAGKTTTISILTGLLEATAGNGRIYGLRLSDDMDKIRELTGVCPQHDVLHARLTVKEHLFLYGRIKGIPEHLLPAVVDYRIAEVALTEKADVYSTNLSGGQKRKLSLAIALVGNPRFVLLDEPTSGIDVYSRRSVWNLLRHAKKGRVIVLTTHFMDEADLLGDRIAIMSHGKLRTCGSSIFLKSRFGIGYNLTLTKSSDDEAGRTPLSTAPTDARNATTAIVNADGNAVTNAKTLDIVRFLRNHVPEAAVLSECGGEIVLRLPLGSVHLFPAMFRALDAARGPLGVNGYGVSVTTLEEVFLSLAKAAERERREAQAERRRRLHVQRLAVASASHDAPAGPDAEALQIPRTQPAALVAASANAEPGEDEFDEREADTFELREAEAEFRAHIRSQHRSSLNAHLHRLVLDWDAAGDVDDTGPAHGAPPPSPRRPQSLLGPVVKRMKAHARTSPTGMISKTTPTPAAEASKPPAPLTGLEVEMLVTQHRRGLEDQAPVAAKHATAAATTATGPRHEGLTETEAPSCGVRGPGTQLGLYGQLCMLLYKRFVTAKRDPKGMMFQVGFPAIQVSLILLIFMFTYLGAGPPLELDTSMYAQPTQVLTTGESVMLGMPQRNKLDLQPLGNATNATTSWTMSEHLLATYNDHDRHSRFGAFVYNDSISVNVTVDWIWVRDNLDFVAAAWTGVQGDVYAYLDGRNLSTSVDLHLLLSNPTVLGLLSNYTTLELIAGVLGMDINTTVAEVEQQTASLLGASAQQTLVMAIADALITANVTSGNETTLMELFVLLNANSGNSAAVLRQAIPSNTQLFFRTASFNASSATVTFHGVGLRTGNWSYVFGDVTISVPALGQLLPGAVESYEVFWHPSWSAMHNSSSFHAVAAFRGEVVSSAFRKCFGQGYSYKSTNHPLPLTARQSIETQVILGFLASIFILIPLCYVPAAFCIFLVRERITKAKFLQLVSGVNPYMYWIATYAWDVMLFTTLVLVIMGAFAAYPESASRIFLSTADSGWAVFLLLFTYGISVLPNSYLYSFGFDSPGSAQIAIVLLNFGCGFVFAIAHHIMLGMKETRAFGEHFRYFAELFPPYNLGQGLINVAVNYATIEFFDQHTPYLSWDVAGRPICYMAAEAVFFFALVLLSESSVIKTARRWWEEYASGGRSVVEAEPDEIWDEDVKAEKERVLQMSRDSRDCILRLENLRKTYPPPLLQPNGRPKRAVRGLYMAVPPGEVFGLLGINGAGKSSTLGVITRDIAPSGGQLTVCGYDIADPRVSQLIGYCPQTDPLLLGMTGRETLRFYGRLRGIAPKDIEAVVQRVLLETSLLPFADKVCGAYSGGNKRKLSLGIALVGNPTLLLLDEPSSGMDPESRRKMWNVIAAVSRRRSVVLTTHSMEEAEALCHRVSIMVGGQSRCCGSVQHLKNRFSRGYGVQLRCAREAECVDAVRQSFEARFPPPMCRLKAHHGAFLDYIIRPHGNVHLDIADVFEHIVQNRETLGIVDWGVSQASLESVFIAFAKKQREERGRVVGLDYDDDNDASKDDEAGEFDDPSVTGPGLEPQGGEVKLSEPPSSPLSPSPSTPLSGWSMGAPRSVAAPASVAAPIAYSAAASMHLVVRPGADVVVAREARLMSSKRSFPSRASDFRNQCKFFHTTCTTLYRLVLVGAKGFRSLCISQRVARSATGAQAQVRAGRHIRMPRNMENARTCGKRGHKRRRDDASHGGGGAAEGSASPPSKQTIATRSSDTKKARPARKEIAREGCICANPNCDACGLVPVPWHRKGVWSVWIRAVRGSQLSRGDIRDLRAHRKRQGPKAVPNFSARHSSWEWFFQHARIALHHFDQGDVHRTTDSHGRVSWTVRKGRYPTYNLHEWDASDSAATDRDRAAAGPERGAAHAQDTATVQPPRRVLHHGSLEEYKQQAEALLAENEKLRRQLREAPPPETEPERRNAFDWVLDVVLEKENEGHAPTAPTKGISPACDACKWTDGDWKSVFGLVRKDVATLLKLAEKTGLACVTMDDAWTEQTMMPMEDYESLTPRTKQERLRVRQKALLYTLLRLHTACTHAAASPQYGLSVTRLSVWFRVGVLFLSSLFLEMYEHPDETLLEERQPEEYECRFGCPLECLKVGYTFPRHGSDVPAFPRFLSCGSQLLENPVPERREHLRVHSPFTWRGVLLSGLFRSTITFLQFAFFLFYPCQEILLERTGLITNVLDVELLRELAH